MSKRQFLIILGVWVMVFLFLGFPPEWDKIFGLVVGVLIIIIAFKFKPPAKPVASERVTYTEHKSPKPSGQKVSTSESMNTADTAPALTSSGTTSTISSSDSMSS